jgi:hypothetical protein
VIGMTEQVIDVWKNGKGYIVLTIEDEAGTTRLDYLHRWMWKQYHPDRDIPKGWDIHHYDGDYYNISRDNLWCLPRALHNKIENNRRALKKSIKSRLNYLLNPPKSASILMNLCETMGNRISNVLIREDYIRGW